MRWEVAIRASIGALDLDVALGGDRGPVALIGPNGCGKTTLLRIVAGAMRPTAGHIKVGGRDFYRSDAGLDLPVQARRVGYVPQGFGLFAHLRVIDNVAFGLRSGPRALPRARRRDAAMAMLRELDCAHLAERMPAALSGGEQQRVALARALVIDPAILLLDEPLSAMDASARRRLRGLLAARLNAPGLPSIVVTHDVRDVEALAVSVCVMARGRVVQRGTLAEISAAPANDFVAEFVGLPGHGAATGSGPG